MTGHSIRGVSKWTIGDGKRVTVFHLLEWKFPCLEIKKRGKKELTLFGRVENFMLLHAFCLSIWNFLLALSCYFVHEMCVLS